MPVLRHFLVLWDFPEERYADRSFQVLAAVYPRVHEEYHQERHARNCNSNKHPEQQDAVAVGRDGSPRPVHAVYRPRVVVHHRLRKGVLFPAVQQEHIECFLDFLLAFDGKHLAFFRGDGGETGLCLCFAAARVAPFHVDAHYHVVHRPDDGLLQRVDGIVQFLHHGVAFAAVRYQLVTFQLQGVVLADLALHVHVADA